MKLKKFVKCNSCRDHKKCNLCNNTGKVKNPKLILCNLCGEMLCPINEQIPHGLYEAKVIGKYYSKHLLDYNEYIFSFCEKCLRQLFDKCKIPPTVNNGIIVNNVVKNISYVKDKEIYDYMIWKDEGHFHTAYLNKKCNQIKDCSNDAIYSILINDQLYDDCSCEKHKHEGGSYKLVKFISNELRIFL
jgi:hypothetical protein